MPNQGHEKKEGSQLVYVEVVVSFATAIGLFALTVVQLLYRTTRRARRLWRAENQIRFDGAHFLNKPVGNAGRKIIEIGLKKRVNKEIKPPSFVLTAIVANDRDVRADCLSMLAETRQIFRKRYGDLACLMSMRCCLSCFENALPPSQTEDFLRLYENVLFGQHRVDGICDTLTSDDIKFLYAFFHNTILKEIQ
ncbi:hypothetical protein TRSC58_06018 [Trypanosoma rangeli SC58]|uniref:Uncharacterized protein n=1 Tax=Trypanosoma rangeli SC58 TaxID=429131 RepID=A0A061IW42_TRYRA|nr:hypothetical protein TRSC58_06018 [Trypanosoma rangeli SC58]